jgi:hypothetical protein
MIKRTVVFAALGVVLFSITPGHAAGAPVQDALGSIRLGPGANQVTVRTGDIAVARWFGARIFTVPPGRMVSHTKLYTTKSQYSYTGNTNGMSDSTGKVLCISDFGGTGSPTGGIFGAQAGANDDQADQAIAMVGGFIGGATGCTRDGSTTATKDIVFTFDTPGPITFAFYGAFWGSESAAWRTNAGDTTGNKAWWNLWGNFTDLGYGSTQA